MSKIGYWDRRFPPAIIERAVRLTCRFTGAEAVV
jgi:hypothetical protein